MLLFVHCYLFAFLWPVSRTVFRRNMIITLVCYAFVCCHVVLFCLLWHNQFSILDVAWSVLLMDLQVVNSSHCMLVCFVWTWVVDKFFPRNFPDLGNRWPAYTAHEMGWSAGKGNYAKWQTRADPSLWEPLPSNAVSYWVYMCTITLRWSCLLHSTFILSYFFNF